MKTDVLNGILKQYDDRIKNGDVDAKDLESILKTVCDLGRKIKDADQRDHLRDLALEIGKKLYEISYEFPDIEIKPYDATFDLLPEIVESDKNESERKDGMSDVEKLHFEWIRDYIEQVKKAIEASQNKIEASQNKIVEALEKTAEKKPPAPPAPSGSYPDIQAIKASVDEIKKTMEGSQNSKIMEALEKIKETAEKKPAPPPPGPSPDIQALKEGTEQTKKAVEASQNKIVEAIEKLREAVEKKPAPPPPPPAPPGPSADIQALKESVEQIKKAVEATQIEPIKTMNIIVLVICILTIFGMIWLIALVYTNNKSVEEMKDDLFPRKGKKTSQVEQNGKSASMPYGVKSVKLNESLHIIGGQAVVRLEKLTEKSVNIELTLPNMKVYKMEEMKVGNRMRFEHDSETYFLDLIKISKDSAKVKVYKRTSA